MTDRAEHPRGLSERDLKVRRQTGSRIRSLREDRGWSATELSRRTRIPVNRLSRIENGHIEPGLLSLLALREALGLSVDAMLSGTAVVGPVKDPRLAEVVSLYEAAANPAEVEALLHVLRAAAAGLRMRRRTP